MIKNIAAIIRRSFPGSMYFAFAGTVWLSGAGGLRADAPPALTAIRFNGTDFEGRATYSLGWDAASNTVYRLQTRPGFESNTTWETFDVAVPTEARGVFIVTPETVDAGSEAVRRQFFRVLTPQPEIFRIEPAVTGTNGGTIYLFGQELDTNGMLRVGGTLVIPPTVLQPGTLYSFTVPPLGEGSYDIEWMSGGVVVARKYKLYSATGQPTPVGEAGTWQRLQEPPAEPPASPVSARGKKLYVGNLPFSATDQRTAFLSKKGYDYYMSRISAANGECVVTEEDLSIPGRGLDFVWTRTYRSRNGTNTSMGQNWDHAYNIHISASADQVLVFGGNGQSSDFFLGSNGLYTANERFEEGTFSNGEFTLTFPDTGKWIFNSLSNAIAPGMIARIEDRNGNVLQCSYDDFGRLSQIVDTLGRSNTISYAAGGNRIVSITDFSGRSVVYGYYRGEAGGAAGDLKTVRSPLVIDTPNTNDFPAGKTTTYTYTSGFADNRLNHNLTSVRDPKGQLQLLVEYNSATNPADVNFDRINVTQCGANPPTVMTYIPQSPMPSNSFAVMKTIVNDPVGNVTIDWFDSLNRNIIHRDLAARAVPGTTLTESNLPTVKLRDSDPDFWETRCTWNLDSLCTRVLWPEGNSDECVYERDFNPDCSARHKADIRVLRAMACCVGDLNGDGLPDRITSYFQHDPRFGSRKSGEGNPWLGDISSAMGFSTSGKLIGVWGSTHSKPRTEASGRFANGPRQTISLDGTFSPSNAKIITDRDTGRSKGFGFVISSTDPRGNVDRAEYDAQGNCTRLTHSGRLLDASDAPVCSFEYNSHGQLTAIVNPADANGFTRRDEITYYDSGARSGYTYQWTIDTTGPTTRTTSYDYDAVGNVTQLVDPRGNTNRWIHNALNQVVKTKAPDLDCTGCVSYERTSFYDASDNLVRVEQDDRDFNGAANTNKATWTTFYDYDELNRCTLLAHEVTHTVQQNGAPPVAARYATNRFVYDGLNNVIESHSPEAVNGNQPANFVRYEYDTRNLPFRTTHAPGSADGSTSQWGYDGNGRRVRAEHGAGGGGGGGVLRYTYDSLGLVVRATDSLGNTGTSRRNANGALVYERIDGETNDVPGSAGNVRLSETRYEYDSLDRLTTRTESFFDSLTQIPLLDGSATTTFTYAPNGACRSVTDDNGHTTRYSYDTSGRLATTTDPKTNTVSYTYDPNGNVVAVTQSDSSDVTPGVQIFTMRYQYDAMDRCVSDFDNIGNTTRYFYDSQNNLVQQIDPRGVLQVNEYDGLCRKTRTFQKMGVADILTRLSTQTWDDNGRLISMSDANSNATVYAYDALNRCVQTMNADGTHDSLVWSPRSNLSSRTDANGTVITFTYDDLDRCVRKDIAPGTGVSSLTTFETFQYDGMSRCVMASNDVSMLDFGYDSMGNIEKQKQDCIAAFVRYDGVGNCLSLTHPSGRVVTYSYDAIDQVTRLDTSAGKGLPTVNLATFAYEGPGRLARMTRGNGINTRWNWDGQENSKNAPDDFGWKQVSAINHQVAGGGTVIDQRIATYDRNQNKTRRQQTVPFAAGVPAMTTNIMAYDALNRMSSFTRNRASVAYTKNYALDGNGNRQSVSSNGVATTYTMDSTTPEPADFQMNQYTGTPFGTEQHDHNGNLVSVDTAAGSTRFTYDYADRLVSVERTAGPAFVPVASFTYDALGRRISKTVTTVGADGTPTSVTTQKILDPTCDTSGGRVMEERENGALRTAAIWPHMHQSAQHMRISAAGDIFYSHADELGTVLAVTDASGHVLERYEYDDFGAPRFLTADGVPIGIDGAPATSSTVGNEFLFQGMTWDGETGLYYSGHSQGATSGGRRWASDPYAEDSARMLDPKTGRSLTRGHGASAGGSRYSLGGDNPWSAAIFNPKEYSLNAVTYGREKLKGTTKTQGDFNLANRFSFEIDGVTTGGFKSVSGLESETEVIEYKDGEDRTIHTRPGNHKAGKMTLSKDWSNTHEWYSWRKAVLDGKVERKSISVIFHNDAGEEAGRMNFFHCWPTKWKGPALNAKNSGHATEKLEISWETMELKAN